MQRQNLASVLRLSRVLWLSLLVVTLGGLLERGAMAQTISFGPKSDFFTGIFPYSLAVGDFNGDGKLDLAVGHEDPAAVAILLGTGTGTFGAKTDIATTTNPSVAVGDFNGDGKLDLAVSSSIGVSILLGTGTGTFGASTDFSTGGAPISIAVGDFNGDGKLDLATANFNSGTVSILLGTGTGTFGASTDIATGSNPVSVAAVGDFNGDGKLDLAVANENNATVSILLGTGTGTFGAKTDFATGNSPFSIAIGDFNGDGKLDLAVTNLNGATVSIFLGTGTGTFGVKYDFATGSFPRGVVVGDFNRDGKVDLALAKGGFANAVSVLPGTGTGSFGAQSDFGTGYNPISIAVADFNGDGKLDLAVTNLDGSTVSILLNTTGNSRVDSLASLFNANGGTGRLEINAAPGCNWTAMSNDPWITITSAISGTGASALNYSVAANPSANPRNGSLVIAGQRYLIAQEAQVCSFSISPGSASIATSGGTGSVNVTTLLGCNWTGVSNAPWITITSGGSGGASGAVNYSVAANVGSTPRSGTMTIAGQTFTVNQAGSGIVVVAPNGGETWPKGSTQVIRWTFAPSAGAQVKIELLKGGALNSTIVAKTPIGTGGVGSFNWLIPTTLSKGSDYQVRVTSVTDATLTDTSDAAFTIGITLALLKRIEAPDQSFIAEASSHADLWRESHPWNSNAMWSILPLPQRIWDRRRRCGLYGWLSTGSGWGSQLSDLTRPLVGIIVDQ